MDYKVLTLGKYIHPNFIRFGLSHVFGKNLMKLIILILGFALLNGCVAGPVHYDETELNSDLEYSAHDGRWYHSNPPKSRDTMSFDRATVRE